MTDPSDREPPEHFAPEQYPPDPIQHLRELMAKAAHSRSRQIARERDGATWDHAKFCEVDCLAERAKGDEKAANEALRNLAPQLLEVAEAARSVAEWHDEVHAGNGVRYARLVITLREKLAALGGKGGGG